MSRQTRLGKAFEVYELGGLVALVVRRAHHEGLGEFGVSSFLPSPLGEKVPEGRMRGLAAYSVSVAPPHPALRATFPHEEEGRFSVRPLRGQTNRLIRFSRYSCWPDFGFGLIFSFSTRAAISARLSEVSIFFAAGVFQPA